MERRSDHDRNRESSDSVVISRAVVCRFPSSSRRLSILICFTWTLVLGQEPGRKITYEARRTTGEKVVGSANV